MSVCWSEEDCTQEMTTQSDRSEELLEEAARYYQVSTLHDNRFQPTKKQTKQKHNSMLNKKLLRHSSVSVNKHLLFRYPNLCST